MVGTRFVTRSVIVAVVVLISPFAAFAAEKIDNVAVFSVGIDKYKSINSICGAANDAQGVAARFQAHGRQLGLTADAVWVHTLLDEQATQAEILAGLKKLRERAAPNTLAVINLSGHGMRTGGAWYFIPHDFGESRSQMGIPGAEVAAAARDLAKRGCTVVVIIDACFAGEFRHDANDLLDEFREGAPGGVLVLTSCASTQTSLGGSHNGYFTAALLDGLGGAADADGDGTVTFKEIKRFMGWRLKEGMLRGVQFPGFAHHDQDFVCDSSLSVPENLPLSVLPKPYKPGGLAGNAKLQITPKMVRPQVARPWMPLVNAAIAASNRKKTDGLLVSADLQGEWEYKDGNTTYTLAFGKLKANGWGDYTVTKTVNGRKDKSCEGDYSFQNYDYGAGNGADVGYTDTALVLVSKNRTDRLALLAGAGEGKIRIATSLVEHFLWEQAKKLVQNPSLRPDFPGENGAAPAPLKPIRMKTREEASHAPEITSDEFLERTRGYVVVEPRYITLTKK